MCTKPNNLKLCTQVERFTQGACTICLRISNGHYLLLGMSEQGLKGCTLHTLHTSYCTNCTAGANCSSREKWRKKLVALHIVEYPSSYCKYSAFACNGRRCSEESGGVQNSGLQSVASPSYPFSPAPSFYYKMQAPKSPPQPKH